MAKYIVIGLGNFGSSLSTKLTSMGHEVIAVDNSPSKVEHYKDCVTNTICMDVTEESALRTLPIKDSDAVIMSIGEDFGASVHSTALLKQLGAKRIVGRVINPVHETIISAIGVDDLIMPEEESADRLAKSMDMKGVIDSFAVGGDYSIVEANVPPRYIGKTIAEVDFRGRYNLNVVTIKKVFAKKGMLGKVRKREVISGVVKPEYPLQKTDVIVLFGRDKDLEMILK